MGSIWNDVENRKIGAPLTGVVKTDVAVIGAGLCGVLTASFLQERGLACVLITANRAGDGASGNTTAKITAQHGLKYHTLIRKHGRETAQKYAQIHLRAIRQYEELIGRRNIDCGFESQDAVLFSEGSDALLKLELEATLSLGLPADFLPKLPLPFPTAGGLRFSRQAQFHPREFLNGLLNGLTIYENTPALHVEGTRVDTPLGSVEAKDVVFACRFPFVDVPGWYPLRLSQRRSYLMAFEGVEFPDGMYRDIRSSGTTLRHYGKTLILGVGDHRSGRNTRGGMYERIRRFAQEHFPDAKELCAWSAEDGKPLDELAYIGQYGRSRAHWYVACGFDKWGMTHAMAAARAITGLICGEGAGDSEIFDPGRMTPRQGAGEFFRHAGATVKGLMRYEAKLPQTALDALLPGEGGILTHRGRKVAAYKNEAGETFTFHARCPHLGCCLSWNPDDHTFECPCHGSRFSGEGEWMDAPALPLSED